MPDIAPATGTVPPAFELEVADQPAEPEAVPAGPTSSIGHIVPEVAKTDLEFDPLPIEVPEIDQPVIPNTAAPAMQSPPAPEIAEPVAKPRFSKPFMQPRTGSPAESSAAAPARPSAPVFKPTPGMPIQTPKVPEITEPVPAIPKAAPAAAEPPEAATPEPAAPSKRPVNPFLSKDPAQKARRLARALVSDMIVYQPKKRQDALEAGNLKEAFDEEIKKSWEEYVQQVGEDLADSNDYFKEALNEILAGGRKIF